MKPSFRSGVALVCAILLFLSAQQMAHRAEFPRPAIPAMVTLPLTAQILTAGGDRFLAANLGGFRALVATAETLEASLPIQAAIQYDVALLNGGHEDNYYLAAGVLVGGEFHDNGMDILRRAADARPFDFVPAFFLAVNTMHYERDFLKAAEWMKLAAMRADTEENRMALEKTAARWVQKGADPQMAAKILDAMAKQSRSRNLRLYIEKRAEQARHLQILKEAAARYHDQFGKPAGSLDDLTRAGLLASIPVDPLGRGYVLSATGIPEVSRNPGRSKR